MLDDQCGQRTTKQHHGNADHDAVTGKRADDVDLIGQGQADIHHGPLLAVLRERHRQNAPRRTRGTHRSMIGIGGRIGQNRGDGIRGVRSVLGTRIAGIVARVVLRVRIGLRLGRIVGIRRIVLYLDNLLDHSLRGEWLTERDA